MVADALALVARFKNSDLLYGYIPTEWICILFVVLFGLSTFLHVGQATYYRIWWLLPTIVLSGLGETIGWAGRLWSSQTFRANAVDPYLMQISSTIIAPTPMLAANFLVLSILIKHLGVQYSRLPPMWYSIIFVTADIGALIVQAVGGASASAAVRSPKANPTKGGNIMLGGIVVQMVAIIIYSTLAFEFVYRYVKNRPVRKDSLSGVRRGDFDEKVKLMFVGLLLSTLFIFIRAIYRTIELSGGWTGNVIRTEVWFNIFDGGMITLALYTLNFLHPGLLLNHLDVGKPRGRQVQTADDTEKAVRTETPDSGGAASTAVES